MNTSMIFPIGKNDEGTQFRGIRNTNISSNMVSAIGGRNYNGI